MRTSDFHRGDSVVYTPPHGKGVEYGTVTSVNSRWVFVRYERDEGSKATHPDNLTVLARKDYRP